MDLTGKCIIFSAPSGAGKTTIVKALMKTDSKLAFSISACSRSPRTNEIDGKDYHFLTIDEFKAKIANHSFIDWEEVYPNNFYGTLKSEIERLWALKKVVLFDVDAYGGVNLKKFFGDAALSIFIAPPSVDELGKRLRNRSTETEDKIQTRLAKAAEELQLKEQFDMCVVNDVLETTVDVIREKINEFIRL